MTILNRPTLLGLMILVAWVAVGMAAIRADNSRVMVSNRTSPEPDHSASSTCCPPRTITVASAPLTLTWSRRATVPCPWY